MLKHECALAIQGYQVLGQLDSPAVEAVQLLHDEFEVRGQARLTGEAPDDRRDGHDGGQQQQSAGEVGREPTDAPHKVLEYALMSADGRALAGEGLTDLLQLQLLLVPHKHPPCSQLQEGPGPKGCQVIGQLDSPVVEVVQLLHDEFEVRGQARLTGEAPDDRRDGHEGGQQQQSGSQQAHGVKFLISSLLQQLQDLRSHCGADVDGLRKSEVCRAGPRAPYTTKGASSMYTVR
ncbi:hypothetical protein CRUP_036970 [Coryphaenoides rupestris]|nr:hypothetical protein CRUP_036970 [Coryphaenoides rupestris]